MEGMVHKARVCCCVCCLIQQMCSQLAEHSFHHAVGGFANPVPGNWRNVLFNRTLLHKRNPTHKSQKAPLTLWLKEPLYSLMSSGFSSTSKHIYNLVLNKFFYCCPCRPEILPGIKVAGIVCKIFPDSGSHGKP